MCKQIFVSLLLLFSIFAGISAQTQSTTDELESTSRWQQTDDDWKRMVEIKGRAEFTDDYKDVRDVTPGGYVKIEEERDGTSHRYEVRHASGGSLTRSYFVDGMSHAIDQAARDWIAKTLLQAVRHGFDAENRAQSILRQRGVAGVLAEIDQIEGDYAKRHYFEALIKFGNLDETALQNVLRKAAAQISSDYEQAQLLIGVAPTLTNKRAAINEFFAAVATVKSDYERARILKNVLEKNPQSRELLIGVAASTKSIQSDYEKAGVLKHVSARYIDDSNLRDVFFQTVNTIRSDYEHRGVLTALIKNKDLSADVLNYMLSSAATISSDYEKATFLLEVSNTYTGDARLKEAFLKVVETIKSDYERGRVLSALLKNKQIG
jgi:uncharacterized protein YeeX (DUF496 family)